MGPRRKAGFAHWPSEESEPLVDPRGYTKEIKSLDGPVYIIKVGDQGKTWAVHERLLVQNSSFFRSATKSEWTKDNKIIPMPDDDQNALNVYVSWLYADRLLVRETSEESAEFAHTKEHGTLIESHLFGEKIQDRIFQDDVMDGLLAWKRSPKTAKAKSYPTRYVNRVYDGTPSESPLRLFLVDLFIEHGSDDWIEPSLHPDFLFELSKSALRDRKSPFPSWSAGTATANARYHFTSSDAT